MNKAGIQAALGQAEQFFPVIGHAPSRAPQGERRTHNNRKADLFGDCFGLRHGTGNTAGGDSQADVLHGIPKQLAVFSLLDHLDSSPDHIDPVALEHSHFGDPDRNIQGRLTAERRQQGIGALPCNHLGHGFRRDRFDVSAMGRLRVGHDRGRVAVDEHDFIALLPEGLTGLGARIVKFAGLADDDRARADDEDLLDVVPFGHEILFLATGSSSSVR